MANIKTIKELKTILKERWENDEIDYYGKLYVSSKEFKSINVIDLNKDSDVFIGEHMLSVFDQAYSLIWLEKNKLTGYMHQHSRSLLDANVTVDGNGNGYNDWHLFTTEEEAKEYSYA